MGRPPLSKKSETVKTTIRMTEEIRDRIAAVTDENGIAEFIREAIERELKRRERAG
jgi:predicted DNA-binding protein